MENQIEEMAKVLLETSCKGSECENCAFVKSVKEAEETCVCLKALYNANYRKIPEYSVVLTREAYQDLKEYKNISEQRKFNLDYANVEIDRLEHELKQARKETASEILSVIHKELWDEKTPIANTFVNVDIKVRELAKQYGVEIEE